MILLPAVWQAVRPPSDRTDALMCNPEESIGEIATPLVRLLTTPGHQPPVGADSTGGASFSGRIHALSRSFLTDFGTNYSIYLMKTDQHDAPLGPAPQHGPRHPHHRPDTALGHRPIVRSALIDGSLRHDAPTPTRTTRPRRKADNHFRAALVSA